MKYYLLAIDEVGGTDVHGPFDSSAQRDAEARAIKKDIEHELGEDHGYLFIKVCGEVLGRLEAEGFTTMDLL